MNKNKKSGIKKRTKKESFFTKCVNALITLVLTAGMLYGLQACSGVGATSLKFAQLSDVHFLEHGANTTYKMTGESPALLDDAVEQINEQSDLDFAMVTGDLIDKSFEKELRAVLPHMEKLNIPWYFAFGNHDRCVGGYLNTLVYMEMLRNSNPDFRFKKSYYAFSPKKNFKVIVLDNIITDEITSNGYIDETQFKWLKKELDSSKNDVVLLFMHVPVIEPFASPSHKLRNAAAVKALIESYKNPIGVFQGHYHAAKVTQHDNVLYVSSPALVSYPNAFRIVTVTNTKDKVTFDLVWKETRLKNIQKTAKMLVFGSIIYTGEKQDQSATYEIKKQD